MRKHMLLIPRRKFGQSRQSITIEVEQRLVFPSIADIACGVEIADAGVGRPSRIIYRQPVRLPVDETESLIIRDCGYFGSQILEEAPLASPKLFPNESPFSSVKA